MCSKGDLKLSLLSENEKNNNENFHNKNLAEIDIDEEKKIDKDSNFVTITKNLNKKELNIEANDKENQSLICNSPENSHKLLNKKTNRPVSNHSLSSGTINLLNKIINNVNSRLIDKINIKKPENFSKNINQQLLNSETKNKNKNIEKIELSTKALETIKKLKDKQNLKNEINTEEKKLPTIENSFSRLNIKYKELLSKSRELRLPVIYKELFDNFNALEQAINRNKIGAKKIINSFYNIRLSIEAATHKTFNLNILKKILYVVPHFYILKYSLKKNLNNPTFSINDDIDKNYDLIIDIPDDYAKRISTDYEKNFNFLSINFFTESNLNYYHPAENSLSKNDIDKRKQIFYNILLYITTNFYKKFLKQKKIKSKFDPLKERTWHHEFDPDIYCSDIPLFEIPSPPKIKSVFMDMINKNDLRTQIMKLENENCYNDNTPKKYISKSESKYVSKEFLDKIRNKEKVVKLEKEINEYNFNQNKQNDKNKILKNTLIQIKTLLMTNKNSMQLNKLSDLILGSNIKYKNFFINNENLNKTIIEISKQFKGFINIINHSSLGTFVVLENNEYNIPDNLPFINIEISN